MTERIWSACPALAAPCAGRWLAGVLLCVCLWPSVSFFEEPVVWQPEKPQAAAPPAGDEAAWRPPRVAERHSEASLLLLPDDGDDHEQPTLPPCSCEPRHDEDLSGGDLQRAADQDQTSNLDDNPAPTPAPRKKMKEWVAWFFAILSTFAVVVTIIWTTRVLGSSTYFTKTFKRMWFAAFLAVPQFFVVVVPYLVYNFVGASLPSVPVRNDYNAIIKFIPFWAAFSISDIRGQFFQTTWYMLAGLLIGLSGGLLLNLFQNSRACYEFPECRDACPGAEHNVHLEFLIAAVIAYLICALPLDIFLKQSALYQFSLIALSHMNPDEDWKLFCPMIFDGKTAKPFSGFLAATWAVPLGAILRLLFQFSFNTKYIGGGDIEFGAMARIEVELLQLARAIPYNLSAILNLKMGEHYAFEVEQCKQGVNDLRKRIAEVQKLFEFAKWECGRRSSLLRLTQMRWVLELLSKLQLMLLPPLSLVLATVKDGEEEEPFILDLKVFRCHLKKTLLGLLGATNVSREVRLALAEAQDALQEEEDRLEAMASAEQIQPEERGKNLAVLDTLHDVIRAIRLELEDFPTSVAGSMRWTWLDWKKPCRKLLEREWHLKVVKQIVGWWLTLRWSVRGRDYQAACVSHYIFIIQDVEGVVATWWRSVLRLLGVCLGVIGGDIPLTLLTADTLNFLNSPQDQIIYSSWMFFLCLLTSYGSVAFLEWQGPLMLFYGYGGSHIMQFLAEVAIKRTDEAAKAKSVEMLEATYHSIMDMCIAGFVVIIVDTIYAKAMKDPVMKSAAEKTAGCLTTLGELISDLSAGVPQPNVTELLADISEARALTDQAQKDSSMWKANWDTDLAHVTLDECQTLCQNILAISIAVTRLSPQAWQAILEDSIPLSLNDCLEEYSRAVLAGLYQGMLFFPDLSAQVRLPAQIGSALNEWKLVGTRGEGLADVAMKEAKTRLLVHCVPPRSALVRVRLQQDRSLIAIRYSVDVAVADIAASMKRIERMCRRSSHKLKWSLIGRKQARELKRRHPSEARESTMRLASQVTSLSQDSSQNAVENAVELSSVDTDGERQVSKEGWAKRAYTVTVEVDDERRISLGSNEASFIAPMHQES